jgi:hypothetical protein
VSWSTPNVSTVMVWMKWLALPGQLLKHIVENQGALAQMALRKTALDVWLLAQQPVERAMEFLLAKTVPHASSGPSEEVAVAASSCRAVAIPGSSPRPGFEAGPMTRASILALTRAARRAGPDRAASRRSTPI